MKFLRTHVILIGITLISVLFRFYQIKSLPGGLFPDEAANGLDINSIFNGDFQPFYERGNGREALFFYLLAASVSVLGRGPWQHHIVSAGIGVATVIITYLLAKELFGKQTAALSAFFMAVSSFAVTLSRTAFRANLVPLLSALTLYFLVKFFLSDNSKDKTKHAILAGIFFGLGFYTYISFRMMVPLLAFFGLLFLISKRDQLLLTCKEYLRYKLWFLLSFLISFSWLGYYFLSHPGTFIGRAGQVSIFSPELNQGDILGTFWGVFKLTIASFFTVGDLNWRHNVSGYPFLSPFISPFFALGLVVFTASIFLLLVQAWKKSPSFKTVGASLVAVWFWFMLIPEVTTAEGIPHGLRLSGAIPPMFMLAAWGVSICWDKFLKPLRFNKTKLAIASIFLISIFVYNFYLYFTMAARSPEYYYAFRSDLTTVSDYLNHRNKKNDTYLSLDKFSVQTVDYLTTETGNPYVLLDPAHTYEVQLKSGDQVIFTQSTMFDRLRFLESHPGSKLIRQEKNKFGQIIMLVYEQI